MSGFQSLRRPPLQPLTSSGEEGEGRTLREVMVVPWEWAPSTACRGGAGGEEGRREGGARGEQVRREGGAGGEEGRKREGGRV